AGRISLLAVTRATRAGAVAAMIGLGCNAHGPRRCPPGAPHAPGWREPWLQFGQGGQVFAGRLAREYRHGTSRAVPPVEQRDQPDRAAFDGPVAVLDGDADRAVVEPGLRAVHDRAEAGPVPVAVGLGDDHVERASDNFSGRVAEHARRFVVPGL